MTLFSLINFMIQSPKFLNTVIFDYKMCHNTKSQKSENKLHIIFEWPLILFRRLSDNLETPNMDQSNTKWKLLISSKRFDLLSKTFFITHLNTKPLNQIFYSIETINQMWLLIFSLSQNWHKRSVKLFVDLI